MTAVTEQPSRDHGNASRCDAVPSTRRRRAIEHAGDSLHAIGQAENNALGAGGDLLSGDADRAVHDLGAVGDDLKASGKGAVHAVEDLFDW